tara:strand:+ start:7014 stop:7886 length:873 start_codon:yes stop_codon:yes gene_type:complete
VNLPPEILKKVKLLELQSRKLVNNIFSGEYHSAFKGQGMTFSEFREYVHGDDVRNISWNITAKTGRAHIKKYDEERELSTLLLVDISASGDYGSGSFPKGELIVHLAALIGFSAVQNGDQVGLCLYSDEVEHNVPSKKGRANMHRILRDLLYYQPKSKKTCLKNALSYLQGALKKQTNLFIFSDFFDDNYELVLRRMARKHDITVIVVEDPTEHEIPDLGFIDVYDAEADEIITVDTSLRSFQKNYANMAQKRRKELEKTFRSMGVGCVFIDDPKNYVDPLIAFFKRRNR